MTKHTFYIYDFCWKNWGISLPEYLQTRRYTLTAKEMAEELKTNLGFIAYTMRRLGLQKKAKIDDYRITGGYYKTPERFFARPRKCKYKGCTTVLNSYNREKYCYLHLAKTVLREALRK